jgi:hypothetical protein
MTLALRLGSVLTALLKDGGETSPLRACRLEDGYKPSGSVPSAFRLATMLGAFVREGAVSGATVLEREPDLPGAREIAGMCFLEPCTVIFVLLFWLGWKSLSLALSLLSVSGTPSPR